VPCVESAPAARGPGGGGQRGGWRENWRVRGGGPNPERGHGGGKTGRGKGPVKSESGTRAGQIRNGKGRHQKSKKKKDAGVLVFT